MGMRTWIAGGPDLDHATRLLIGFRDHYSRALPSDEQIAAAVERIAADGSGEFLLVSLESRGSPLGVCQLRYRWSAWTGAEDCWIEDVFVVEDARRGGLGRALVEAAIERASERGCLRIELDVDEANEAALSLYRSLGFSDDLKAERRSLLLGRRLG